MGKTAPIKGIRAYMERPLCCSPYHSYRCQGRRDWTLGSLQSRVTSHSGRTGKSASRIEGESSALKSFETETRSTGGLLILLMAALIDPGVTSHNPHRPAKITWKLATGRLMSNLTRPQESTLRIPGGRTCTLISGDSLVPGQGGILAGSITTR